MGKEKVNDQPRATDEVARSAIMEEESSQPTITDSLVKEGAELVGSISLIAAVLGVLAAFLGWRASSAYFQTFGLNPGWRSANVIDLIVTGWLEVLFILLLGASLVLMRILLARLTEELWVNHQLLLFVLSVVLVFALAGLIALRYFFPDFNFLPVVELRGGFFGSFVLKWGLFLVAWWATVVLGEFFFGPDAAELKSESLKKAGQKPIRAFVNGVADSCARILTKPKVGRLLSFLFASRTALILITLTFILFYMLNFASYRGTYFGIRDKTEDSQLPLVSVLSNAPLNIPLGVQITSSSPNGPLYEYSDLRLIDRFDDYIFVFRISDVDSKTGAATIYAVPMDNVESLKISQWRGPTPTPSPSPVLTPKP